MTAARMVSARTHTDRINAIVPVGIAVMVGVVQVLLQGFALIDVVSFRNFAYCHNRNDVFQVYLAVNTWQNFGTPL